MLFEGWSDTKRVVFCTPTLTRPYPQYLAAFEASIPLIKAAGWEDLAVFEVGCPYVSNARATMLRKALDAKANAIVFIDHDLSWEPADLLKLIETPDDVVSGMYRYKKDEEEYMGAVAVQDDGRPVVREDGCVKGFRVPAGFLKITPVAVHRMMKAHPELIYGPLFNPSFDLFQHGAHGGVWYGEDMAFCRRWIDLGGEIWIVPDLSLTHHAAEKSYFGNFHQSLLRQPQPGSITGLRD